MIVVSEYAEQPEYYVICSNTECFLHNHDKSCLQCDEHEGWVAECPKCGEAIQIASPYEIAEMGECYACGQPLYPSIPHWGIGEFGNAEEEETKPDDEGKYPEGVFPIFTD